MALPIFLLTLPHMRFMWGFSFRCHRLTALAAFCWTRARVYAGGLFLYVHFANCYPENRQSTANCTNCSFEPERYHLGTLSSFNHFPQLLVLVGLPTA